MKLSKVQRAYFRLIQLIEEGAEYPDAVFTVTGELALSESQVAAVERKYDSEPTGRAADEVRSERRDDSLMDAFCCHTLEDGLRGMER